MLDTLFHEKEVLEKQIIELELKDHQKQLNEKKNKLEALNRSIARIKQATNLVLNNN